MARGFSAGFLADLLSALHVSAVGCLGATGASDAAAFCARGIDVHDLRLDPQQPARLSAMDRLRAVTRAGPGAVALFGGGGEGMAQEYVGTLATAWLVGEYGFGAGVAGAWVGMLYPALAAQCGCGSG